MKPTDTESEFIEIYRRAKQNNDTDVLISIYAILNRFLEKQGFKSKAVLDGFTRGQYKRAIRTLRVAQAYVMREGRLDEAEEYDRAVHYVREDCLNRMKEIA
jgi:hypothetical protein